MCIRDSVQVILKEQIKGLGAEADVVRVKRGFARNFLVPQGKAYDTTPGNLRQLNHLKALRAEREAKEVQEAEKLAAKAPFPCEPVKARPLALPMVTGRSHRLPPNSMIP